MGEALMSGQQKQTILIVEDYQDSRAMSVMLLEDLDYRVLAVGNGREALQLAIREKPDLVLTDFNLPDIDGITLTRCIRKLSQELAGIPVIMITAREREEVYEMAVAAGCNAVLTKPVSFSFLEDSIRTLLEHSMYRWPRDFETERRTLA